MYSTGYCILLYSVYLTYYNTHPSVADFCWHSFAPFLTLLNRFLVTPIKAQKLRNAGARQTCLSSLYYVTYGRGRRFLDFLCYPIVSVTGGSIRLLRKAAWGQPKELVTHNLPDFHIFSIFWLGAHCAITHCVHTPCILYNMLE